MTHAENRVQVIFSRGLNFDAALNQPGGRNFTSTI